MEEGAVMLVGLDIKLISNGLLVLSAEEEANSVQLKKKIIAQKCIRKNCLNNLELYRLR